MPRWIGDCSAPHFSRGETDKMTNQQQIAALAAGMAAANPDAAEILAEQLGRAARSVKVGGMAGLGIAIRLNRETGQIEIRGGGLEATSTAKRRGMGTWKSRGIFYRGGGKRKKR